MFLDQSNNTFITISRARKLTRCSQQENKQAMPLLLLVTPSSPVKCYVECCNSNLCVWGKHLVLNKLPSIPTSSGLAHCWQWGTPRGKARHFWFSISRQRTSYQTWDSMREYMSAYRLGDSMEQYLMPLTGTTAWWKWCPAEAHEKIVLACVFGLCQVEGPGYGNVWR